MIEVICARSLARGETVNSAHQDLVLGLAFAHLFTATLLHGRTPPVDAQNQLVDDVMLPLLRAGSPVV